MESAVIPFTFNPDLPAHLRKDSTLARHRDALANMPTGTWQKISFKGSRWCLVGADGSKRYLPSMTLDCVVVRANPHVSKRYYAGTYDPNAEPGAPDCWADNGVGPGDRVEYPVSSVCVTCEYNKWGSGTGQGNKLCADVKRLAVLVFASPVLLNTPQGAALDPARALLPGTWELDIPGASLKSAGAYMRDLESRGAGITMVITQLSFEPEASYPQFKFAPLGWISEAEDAAAVAAYELDTTKLQIGLADLARQETADQPKPARIATPAVQPQPATAAPATVQPGGDYPLPILGPVHQPQTANANPLAATPPAPPPGMDAATWAAFQAYQAANAQTAAPAQTQAQPIPQAQAQPETPARRGRGRPPKQDAAPATGFLSGVPAGPAPVAPSAPSAVAPAQPAVVLQPPTSAAVDAILAGIPGLGAPRSP